MNSYECKQKGFTLLEMLLVMAIMSVVVVMLLTYTTQKSDELRRDRAAMQIQQILNAGLAYYVSFGKWPTCGSSTPPPPPVPPSPSSPVSCTLNGASTNDLQNLGFIPDGVIKNPWGNDYTYFTNPDSDVNTFMVSTEIPAGTTAGAAATASIIAGRVPLATVSGTADNIVTAQVNIPGQNLNNARAVNFAGIYNSGDCVPVPTCPFSTMKPTVMVIPVSVSGTNDAGTLNVYPISSFTAYSLPTNPTLPSLSPPPCPVGKNDNCASTAVTEGLLTGTTFWRVCLSVTTEKGPVQVSSADETSTKNMGSILAITRCSPEDEPTGSTFNVYNP